MLRLNMSKVEPSPGLGRKVGQARLEEITKQIAAVASTILDSMLQTIHILCDRCETFAVNKISGRLPMKWETDVIRLKSEDVKISS